MTSHPLVLCILGLAGVFCLSAWLPSLTVMPAILSLIGLGVLAGGILAAAIADAALRIRKNADALSGRATLLDEGLFSRSRNPISLALTAILAGAALLSGNLAALAVPPAVFAALALYLVPREEAGLEEKFGQDYLEYKKRTPRWL